MVNITECQQQFKKNINCPIKASFILGYATGSVLCRRLDIKIQRVWGK